VTGRCEVVSPFNHHDLHGTAHVVSHGLSRGCHAVAFPDNRQGRNPGFTQVCGRYSPSVAVCSEGRGECPHIVPCCKLARERCLLVGCLQGRPWRIEGSHQREWERFLGEQVASDQTVLSGERLNGIGDAPSSKHHAPDSARILRYEPTGDARPSGISDYMSTINR
jgi:hypothetical protein